ncbi:RNA polymerase sigma factor [Nannocystaceae bacterium ST9]
MAEVGLQFGMTTADRGLGARAWPASRPEKTNESVDSNPEQIVVRYRDFMCQAARRMCVRDHDVDDVVQEASMVVCQRMSVFERRSGLKTWLYAIVRNVIRNHRRMRERYERKLSEFGQRPPGQVWTVADHVVLGHTLDGLLAELDDSVREVLILSDVMGCTGREIAEMLEINPNTAASRLRLARRLLAERIAGSDEAECEKDERIHRLRALELQRSNPCHSHSATTDCFVVTPNTSPRGAPSSIPSGSAIMGCSMAGSSASSATSPTSASASRPSRATRPRSTSRRP